MTTKEPLYERLFREPQLYELARFVSYGGRRDNELKAKVEEMREQHTGNKMMWALVELTKKDEATGLTVLKPEVRKLCRGLLGPAPEDDDYQRYWDVNKRTPPPEHQPPEPEVEAEAPKPVKKRGRARVTPSERDVENAALREGIASKQNAQYQEAALLALATLGPGWKPWMRLTLIDADHRTSGNTEPAAVVYKVYRGDEKISDNAMFIRKMPDGTLLKDRRYEPLFGDMLTEPHPYETMEIRGERVPVGRYELCWGPLETYKPRDADQLAALRVSRERGKQERADKKWTEENPLLAWADEENQAEERGR